MLFFVSYCAYFYPSLPVEGGLELLTSNDIRPMIGRLSLRNWLLLHFRGTFNRRSSDMSEYLLVIFFTLTDGKEGK